jgi:hypothetical protein
MQGTSRSELAAKLAETARLCEENVQVYLERRKDGEGVDVVSALLLVAAAMDTAARATDDDAARETALLITSTLAADAIDAAERRGLDESLLDCVTALRRVSELCQAALA